MIALIHYDLSLNASVHNQSDQLTILNNGPSRYEITNRQYMAPNYLLILNNLQITIKF